MNDCQCYETGPLVGSSPHNCSGFCFLPCPPVRLRSSSEKKGALDKQKLDATNWRLDVLRSPTCDELNFHKFCDLPSMMKFHLITVFRFQKCCEMT